MQLIKLGHGPGKEEEKTLTPKNTQKTLTSKRKKKLTQKTKQKFKIRVMRVQQVQCEGDVKH